MSTRARCLLLHISHMGGVGKYMYTNTQEALDDSIHNQKFAFIEIDMLETKDKKILAGHDWKSVKKSIQSNDTTDTHYHPTI